MNINKSLNLDELYRLISDYPLKTYTPAISTQILYDDIFVHNTKGNRTKQMEDDVRNIIIRRLGNIDIGTGIDNYETHKSTLSLSDENISKIIEAYKKYYKKKTGKDLNIESNLTNPSMYENLNEMNIYTKKMYNDNRQDFSYNTNQTLNINFIDCLIYTNVKIITFSDTMEITNKHNNGPITSYTQLFKLVTKNKKQLTQDNADTFSSQLVSYINEITNNIK